MSEKITIYYKTATAICGRIDNFPTCGVQLEHGARTLLRTRTNIVPILRAGGSLSLTGLASRQGDPQRNLDLSRQRVDAVLAFLRAEAGSGFRVQSNVAQGEQAAALAGVRDGNNDEQWRSVTFSAWNRPAPPPPPPPPAPPPPVCGQPTGTYQDLERMDVYTLHSMPPQARLDWYRRRLQPFDAQLRASAACNNIPPQLLATVILNE